MLLWAAGLRWRSRAWRSSTRTRSYVLVSNHLSLMDTPLVMARIPLQFRFFAKEGLFRVPFLGGHLNAPGTCQWRATTRARACGRWPKRARAIAGRGISVLVFPGGRPVRKGNLSEFKRGAAYLAIKAGVPAVPIGITGTRESLPMGSVMVRPARVRLAIGEPIPTAGLKPQDHGRLTASC